MKIIIITLLLCCYLQFVLTASNLRKYTINYREDQWSDLRRRLNESIVHMKTHPEWLIPLYEQSDRVWKMGAHIDQVIELAEYWRDEFDWKKQVDVMNERMPHFEQNIDGIDVRFAWIESQSQSSLPFSQRKVIMIIHGWPGSFMEFNGIRDALVNEHGFDLVLPSLPGYGYSSIPARDDYHMLKVGRMFAQLMKEIGYERYIVQGGDWGSIVGEYVARVDSEHCIGYHSNMCMVVPHFMDWVDLTVDLLKKLIFGTPLSENKERFSSFVYDIGNYLREQIGYQSMQSTKPDSIAVALLDSPIGLMNYILDKFISWSDIEPRDATALFNVISRDDFLTNVMIYYTTGTIASSMRKYYSTQIHADEHKMGRKAYLQTPTACAVFKDLFRAPYLSARRNFNLLQFNTFHKGGHFAAMENGQALVSDIISFHTKLNTQLKNEL